MTLFVYAAQPVLYYENPVRRLPLLRQNAKI